MLKNGLMPKLRVTDQYLIENNIIKKSDLAPIQLESLHIKIEVENIKQGSIGNCYLLAGLGNIIESCPNALNNIVKITNVGIEVTLHDQNDPSKIFIYVIDPTKIILSNHTHDMIFIIEKAYAIHRIIKEKHFNENEIFILEKLQGNQFNIDNTFDDLKEFKIDSINVTKKMINSVKEKHDQYLTYKGALSGGSVTSVYTTLLGVGAGKEIIPQDCDAEYLLTNFISNIISIKSELNGWKNEFREKEILIKIFGHINSPEALLLIDAITPTCCIWKLR